jgi:mannan endo-1,4-beta-mannosidase
LENRFIKSWLGLYLPDEMESALWKAFQYNLYLKKKIQILSFYMAWGSGRRNLDLSKIQAILENGFIPMVTWEPWRWPQELPEGAQPEEQSDYSLSEILKGRYDDYIRSWALDLKQIPGPILLRPMHEMNGNWYPWCGRVNGNQPEKYIESWRYLRSIFREVRNDRLIWVWSPYAHSVPDDSDNEIWRYYPGPKEVDWLALDGYNWGKTQEWSKWQSFEEIFEKGYEKLHQLSPEKPFMIAETGCAEEGGDKGRWIEEAFDVLKNRFPKIKIMVWFNIKKESDWRIESSYKSLQSFQKGVKSWVY